MKYFFVVMDHFKHTYSLIANHLDINIDITIKFYLKTSTKLFFHIMWDS